MRRFWLAVTVVAVSGVASLCLAQPPLPPAGNLQRLPDDQVEGTIFEYKGTLKSKPKEGEELPVLEGKFRIEESAIFDVSPTFKLPSKDEVKKIAEDVAKGSGPELKLPAAPQQKRLGQYRKIARGKMRLDFNDPDSLQGIMILMLQKKTGDVWVGNFTEKREQDGKKVSHNWQVEVRPIED